MTQHEDNPEGSELFAPPGRVAARPERLVGQGPASVLGAERGTARTSDPVVLAGGGPGGQVPGAHVPGEPGQHQLLVEEPYVPGLAPEPQPVGGLPVYPGSDRRGAGSVPTAVVGAKRRRRSVRLALVVPIVLLALLVGGAGGVLAVQLLEPEPVQSATLPPPADVSAERPPDSVAGIAAAVLPSVVSIEVNTPDGQSTGSGFVLREDGYIVTNQHVVDGVQGSGSRITVLFADGTEERATMVGGSRDYDIAVVRVERASLEPLSLGDSDAVVVGDQVVAVGAPLGLRGTVTSGIVSAVNRPVTAGPSDERSFINAVQTDAAINPGNSGGPLVNVSGEVVGVNSAIAQPPGAVFSGGVGSIGLGFAIPSNQVRRTAEQLIETGQATFPVIGVFLDSRHSGEGVRVTTESSEQGPPIAPDGPADRAGIRPGDVIVAIDGRPVTEPDELIVAIRAKAPGDMVVLTIRSGEDERDVSVVLDEQPSE